MNTYVTLACLLAVLGACHSNPVGYGVGGLGLGYGYGAGYGYGGYYAPAVSTANLYKAAPISVIRTAAVSPIIAPAVSTVPVLKTVGVGGWGGLGYGWGGLGWGGLGWGNNYGYAGWGGKGLGYGGWGGKGLGYGWGGIH